MISGSARSAPSASWNAPGRIPAPPGRSVRTSAPRSASTARSPRRTGRSRRRPGRAAIPRRTAAPSRSGPRCPRRQRLAERPVQTEPVLHDDVARGNGRAEIPDELQEVHQSCLVHSHVGCPFPQAGVPLRGHVRRVPGVARGLRYSELAGSIPRSRVARATASSWLCTPSLLQHRGDMVGRRAHRTAPAGRRSRHSSALRRGARAPPAAVRSGPAGKATAAAAGPRGTRVPSARSRRRIRCASGTAPSRSSLGHGGRLVGRVRVSGCRGSPVRVARVLPSLHGVLPAARELQRVGVVRPRDRYPARRRGRATSPARPGAVVSPAGQLVHRQGDLPDPAQVAAQPGVLADHDGRGAPSVAARRGRAQGPSTRPAGRPPAARCGPSRGRSR